MGVFQQVTELLSSLLTILVHVLAIPWQLIRSRIHLIRLAEKIPGPPALPIIGNVLQVIPPTSRALFDLFLKIWEKHGNVFRAYMGPILIVTTGNKEDHEIIFAGNEYLSKGLVYLFLKPWLGDGLLISSGDKWRARRKALTPAFHFKILDQFVPVFNSCGSEFVRQLRRRADGAPFDVWPLTKLFTLDVICETIMGVKMNAQTNSTSDYVTAVSEIQAIIYGRALRPWLYLPFIFGLTENGKRYKQCLEILHSTTEQVIKERKIELQMMSTENTTLDVDELGRRRRVAFLDLLLLQARDGSLTDAEIREEVDTFMFEGHDTTAAGIAFTVFLLSRHPRVQEKIWEELISFFDPKEPLEPTIQQLSELKYLDMVIKETLRIFPPVAAVARLITSDLKLGSCAKTVPAGTTLFLSFWILHRNPEVFPDPEAFDPERFTPEQCQRRHPFAYLPFSAGSRNCIGQRFAMLEMKSALAKIIWNFHILADPDYEPDITWEIIMKTCNGISVRMKERIRLTN